MVSTNTHSVTKEERKSLLQMYLLTLLHYSNQEGFGIKEKLFSVND